MFAVVRVRLADLRSANALTQSCSIARVTRFTGTSANRGAICVRHRESTVCACDGFHNGDRSATNCS